MRTHLTAVAAAVLLTSGVAGADITSDKAAALLVFPVILNTSISSIDTLVQISNTSNEPVAARCFYVNTAGHCSNSGDVCYTSSECNTPTPVAPGVCIPSWAETDFNIYLTPQQPLIWRAGGGLLGSPDVPLDGVAKVGVRGTSNVGTRVPPVEDRFLGELKCIVVDENLRPSSRNVLVGSATLVQSAAPSILDATRYNAIGIPAINGNNNGDNNLVLGEEYSACPQTLIVDHYFDGGEDPVTGDTITGAVSLAPCSEDFVNQDTNLTTVTAQFLVYNEFEQRLSTSTPVRCYAMLPLSSIDTRQANRSIFHVAVSGTLAGQTRIRGVAPQNRGLLATYFDLHGDRSSAMNTHYQGNSSQTDLIRIP